MSRRLLDAGLGVALAIALVLAVLPWRGGLERRLHRSFLELTVDRAIELVAVVGLATAVAAFLARSGLASELRARLGRAGARLRAVPLPPEFVLPVIVGAAAAFRIVVNAGASMPRVFADELIYSHLARSFAATGTLLVRGVQDNGHSILYPVLISPLYALAGDGVAAFEWVQVLNAILMSLAAVPSYFLARRVVSERWSLAVAALAVAVPATFYSALVMAESLFYLGFVTLALLLVLALERPTAARQLLAGAALLALVGVRTQALAVVPAIATAVALHGWRTGALRRLHVTWWPLAAVLGVVALGFVAASRIGAEAPTGAYGDLVRLYDPVEVAKWTLWNLGQYQFQTGVVALAAFPLALVRLLRRNAPPADAAFGAAALSLVSWTLISVALLSASPFGLGILHERNLFYVTPLVLVGFAYWLSAGLPRPAAGTLVVAASVVGLALLLPQRLALHPSTIDNPTNVVWLGLDARTGELPFRWLLLGIVVLGLATFLHARSARLPLFAFVLAAAVVTVNLDLHTSPERPAVERFAWIDEMLDGSERASIVHVAIDTAACPAGRDTYQGEAVTWSEFFNTSVDRVYNVLGPVGADGLASPRLTIAADGTLVGDRGPLDVPYVVLDSRVRIHGIELARLDVHEFPGFDTTVPGSLTLWRPERPVRLVFPGPLRGGRPEDIACPGAR